MMENPVGVVARTESADVEPGYRKPSRLECLGGVIVSPVKTFEHLAANPQWLFPLIIIVLYVLVVFVLRMAVMMVSMRIGYQPFGEEAPRLFFLFMAMFSSGLMFVMGYAAAVLVLAAMAGALYAILRAFGTKPRFFALAAALAYAEYVPRLVGSSVKEFAPLLAGRLSFWEPGFPTGIAPIFSEFDVPLLARFFLERIELFHLWSFALVAIVVRFVARVSSERAMLITLIYWGVCILAVTGAVFSWELVTENLLAFD